MAFPAVSRVGAEPGGMPLGSMKGPSFISRGVPGPLGVSACAVACEAVGIIEISHNFMEEGEEEEEEGTILRNKAGSPLDMAMKRGSRASQGCQTAQGPVTPSGDGAGH